LSGAGGGSEGGSAATGGAGTAAAASAAREVATVAVLGAGTMGRGIAQAAAMAGYDTRCFEPVEEAREKAAAAVRRTLAKGVELGKTAAADADAAAARLAWTGDLAAAVAGADLVIEAVPEDVALKIDTFRRVAEHAPAHALFASNTSALSITEMAAAGDRPERFAGMHFFNPVHLMRLIELVRGLDTSDETVAAMREVGRRMGKEVVLVAEAPGFVTTRINVLIGNEAFRMLEQGIASAADIDKALKLGLNHPMGPFEMADLVGLDVRLAILEHLHATLGEAFRPNRLLVQHVRAGRLGRKSGRGIYRYDADGKRVDERVAGGAGGR
jgi:3-hydroxybutyryl-CoA dehydrogenase